MSEDTKRDWKTPTPEISRSGVRLSWSAIGSMLVVGGGIAMAYIFATKAEVGKVESRVASVEKDTGYHKASIDELKEGTKEIRGKVEAVDRKLDAVEINLRTVLTEIGVSSGRIAKPK